MASSEHRPRIRVRHLIDEFKFPRPSRFPTAAYRVRWVRRSWLLNHAGGPSWNIRWYVTVGGASRFAQKLADDGAVVQVDTFRLKYLSTSHVHAEDHR